MITGKQSHRVLVVSSSDKVYEHITELLPQSEFFPIERTLSAGEAKRMLVSEVFDIIIINTPLPDDFGIELALELSEGTSGILLLVKNDSYDQVCFRVENNGVLTLGKPSSKQMLYSCIKLLAAMSVKLGKLEKRNRTLQEKMTDIRVVSRAKWLLIENLNMNEKDAHYYIEKQAMDTRMSRREIAEGIIRTYDK